MCASLHLPPIRIEAQSRGIEAARLEYETSRASFYAAPTEESLKVRHVQGRGLLDRTPYGRHPVVGGQLRLVVGVLLGGTCVEAAVS